MDRSTSFFHVGLTVRDVERSASFYRDVALMEVEPIRDYGGEPFDRLTNNSGARLRWTYATLGEFRLQLVQYLAAGDSGLDLGHNRPGSPHLCFYVPDARAKFAEVRALGVVPITSELVHQPGPRMLSFYVDDPDGVPVEFLERLA